jgi:PIF1-like helicase
MLTNHGLWCGDLFDKRISKVENLLRQRLLLRGGRFQQTLPVIQKGNRATIIKSTIKSNTLWTEIEKLSFTEKIK